MKCLVAASIPEFLVFTLLFFDVLLTSSREALELQSRAAPTLRMASEELVQNPNKAGQTQRNPTPPGWGRGDAQRSQALSVKHREGLHEVCGRDFMQNTVCLHFPVFNFNVLWLI